MNSNSSLSPGLYVVSTPIGNLGDITFRAIETLKAVDLILCEDTRTFSKLASRYGIETPKQAFHEHNEDKVSSQLVAKLKEGMRVALVSDAGTPLISDPGYPLLRTARAADVPIFSVPGPSALVAALSISGFEPNSFYFGGFLPLKPGKRKNELQRCLELDSTVILYESPHKIENTLKLLLELAPKRDLAVVREITKIHEEVVTGKPETLIEHFEKNSPKGEIVLLIRRA